MSVDVSYGANNITSSDFDGLTIDDIYAKTEAALGLPAKSTLSVSVNDTKRDFNYTVDDDAEVEFEKASGSKG